MKNETLYWTIGGVALALLALVAMSRSSGSGGSSAAPSAPAGGGGVNASALVSEVNNANNNAAAVESALISAESSYVTHATDAQAAVVTNFANNATAQLQTVEGAATQRYADTVGAAAQEYADHENALTAQFEATQQTAQNAANNAASEAIAKMETGVAHDISNNETTIARINKGSSFGNFLHDLMGSATTFFGGIGAGGIQQLFGGKAPASPAPSSGGFV